MVGSEFAELIRRDERDPSNHGVFDAERIKDKYRINANFNFDIITA